MSTVAVFGLAIAGEAVARAYAERGVDVRLGDDNVTAAHTSLSRDIGAEIRDVDVTGGAEEFVRGVDLLVPAPGVPPRHSVIRAAVAAGVPVRSEIDVAYEWERDREGGPRPILGVTGTDGKTTTTMLVASILRESGLKVAEVGNTDVPFVAALRDDVDAFVVECSSFRLEFTHQFRCDSSVWLNLAPDHLDWHGTMDDYTRAKARMWEHATPDDCVVAPVGDATILPFAQASGARVRTFGQGTADYTSDGGWLVSPHGRLCEMSSLWRSMPHDVSNSLAACAVAIESGLVGPGDDLARALATFEPAHHRIELVAESQGTRWFDDSKATSPHAALTAIRAFDRLVLIAGGRNKGLDLGQMASEPARMAGVVAIGEDAGLIERAFTGVCPVVRAQSMTEAVSLASSMAGPGVDVLLSPGCTSYDWYANYGERGADFAAKVRRLVEAGALP